jgi:DNA-binding transcriptional ArsR family regulator
MARAAATLDVFSAVAEPKRRQVLDLLVGHELYVNDMVEALGWAQPMISKHLAVLRQVGLVSIRRQGQHRMYRVNGDEMKPIHDWSRKFERFWTEQLDRIKKRAEEKHKTADYKSNANSTNPKEN